MRDAYREIYTSCHMKYGLGAPFTERFFDLAARKRRRTGGRLRWVNCCQQFYETGVWIKKLDRGSLSQTLDLTHACGRLFMAPTFLATARPL